MAFSRPTLKELVERVLADISSRVTGGNAIPRRSNLGVIGRAVAGVAHGLYGFISWLARQVIPDLAEGEFLARWASVWGVGRRPAAPATGSVVFTGTNGIAIPADTRMMRADGAEFATTAEAVIAVGQAVVPVSAVEPGAAGNTDANVSLAVAAQIIGVSATAKVATGGLGGGSDLESDESLRANLLNRIQRPPQGGAAYDYETWAKQIPGVTRAWCRPLWQGPGTVGVLFVRDGDGNFIPDAGEIATVRAYIMERRPVTAEVYVVAPQPMPVAMRLSVRPDTPAVRAAVQAELADLYRRVGAPGVRLPLTHIREAISLAAGEQDHDLQIPSADVQPGPAQIPVLGLITWV
ncbi:baseplate J/gp47 family protein [Pseudoxanthomonas sp. 22568]|uniref:baseplate J/gp47 family protein n=1 Tax=Pseudoxanthomonas sp. 22568 TaxID=3453945 RepID=UPI003F85DFB2